MSSPLPALDHTPLIALVDRLNRVLQLEMVRSGQAAGFPELKQAHNLVFGTLRSSRAQHTSELAARAGVTRQSMGEVVRDLVDLGILEMTVDPEDRRAKQISYTEYGLAVARAGRQHIVDVEARLAHELGEENYARVRDALVRIVDLMAEPARG